MTIKSNSLVYEQVDAAYQPVLLERSRGSRIRVVAQTFPFDSPGTTSVPSDPVRIDFPPQLSTARKCATLVPASASSRMLFNGLRRFPGARPDVDGGAFRVADPAEDKFLVLPWQRTANDRRRDAAGLGNRAASLTGIDTAAAMAQRYNGTALQEVYDTVVRKLLAPCPGCNVDDASWLVGGPYLSHECESTDGATSAEGQNYTCGPVRLRAIDALGRGVPGLYVRLTFVINQFIYPIGPKPDAIATCGFDKDATTSFNEDANIPPEQVAST